MSRELCWVEELYRGVDYFFGCWVREGVGFFLFSDITDDLVAAPGRSIDPEGKYLSVRLPGRMLGVCHCIKDEDGRADGRGDMGCDGVDGDEEAAMAYQCHGLGKGEDAGQGMDPFAGFGDQLFGFFTFCRAAGNEEG